MGLWQCHILKSKCSEEKPLAEEEQIAHNFCHVSAALWQES